jgi:hypothetical protein
MTIEESEKSSASTGRYVETVVMARASAKVGTPRMARIRSSLRSSVLWTVAIAPPR